MSPVCLQGSVLDKPVVDRTGLSEKYDFTLKFTPDASQMTGFGPPPPAAAHAADVPVSLTIEWTKPLLDLAGQTKFHRPVSLRARSVDVHMLPGCQVDRERETGARSNHGVAGVCCDVNVARGDLHCLHRR